MLRSHAFNLKFPKGKFGRPPRLVVCRGKRFIDSISEEPDIGRSGFIQSLFIKFFKQRSNLKWDTLVIKASSWQVPKIGGSQHTALADYAFPYKVTT